MDVEARFPVQLHIVEGAWTNPAEVRATIKSLHAKEGIVGVILVGALPMHLFFMHEHANPNPLYYEDFDLEFVDNDKNGVAHAYKGKPQLKVWVANIRACEKAREDDIPGLRRFFAKTHDYYTGKAVPELRTLLLSTSDWPGTGDVFRRRGAPGFPCLGTLRCWREKPARSERRERPSRNTATRSLTSGFTRMKPVTPGRHGPLIAGDCRHETGSLITINHGCFAGNWTKNDNENSGLNCALSWVFGKHLGQAVVAQVRSGGVGFDNLIYARLRPAITSVKRIFPASKLTKSNTPRAITLPGDIVSGILLIGNPFLKLKPVKPMMRLVIKNAVYGDFANGAVTNVTQLWLTGSMTTSSRLTSPTITLATLRMAS